MSNKTEEVKDTVVKKKATAMATIKIPKEYIEFVKVNPKLSQNVGKLISGILQMREYIEAYNRILEKPNLFKGFLENGTEEQLEGFIKEIYKALNDTNRSSVSLIEGVNKDNIDEIRKAIGVRGHFTEINMDSLPESETDTKS